MKRVAAAVLLSSIWVTGVFFASSPSGDVAGFYTDHLRHMGESLIFLERGFDLYRRPYGELAQAVGVPCADHRGLFEDRTAPYPPLGVLAHAPWALAERARLLTPSSAHHGVVLMWSAVACLALALACSLLRGAGTSTWVVAGLTLFPLLLGTGANGFFDVAYVAAGLAGLWFLTRHRHDEALVFFALAGALHFRAAVFAVPAWLALKNANRFSSKWVAAGLLLPAFAAAAAVSSTLGTIPPHNPLHFSHPNVSLGLFVVATTVAAAALVRFSAPLTASTLGVAALLAVMERSHGFWHALPMAVVPLVLSVDRTAATKWAWATAWAWVVVACLLGFRYPTTVFWAWF